MINGKKNGKLKKYNSNEQLLFEEEYLNDYKINCVRYDKDGDIVYKIEKNGLGIEYY